MCTTKTIIDCPNERVKVLQTPYDRVLYNYNKAQTSASPNRWLERKSRLLRKHIHHALCGHGGERWIVGAMVDVYDPTTRTVFQYYHCHWHGCRRCLSNDRDEIINHKQTREIDFLQQRNVQERSEQLATALSKTGSEKTKNHKKLCQNRQRQLTRTPSSMILNRTTTKRRKTRSQHRSRMKTPMLQFR